MCAINEFDLSRAILQDKPAFEPFALPDRSPDAVYADDPAFRQMQLLVRWYGFSLTFPQAGVYSEKR